MIGLLLATSLLSGCTINASIINNSIDTKSTDTLPTVEFLSDSQIVNKSEGIITINIQLDKNATSATHINFELAGTAMGNGVDYSVISSNPLTIPAGSSSTTLNLALIEDPGGLSNKTIIVNLKDTSTLILGSKTQTTLTLIEAPLPPLLVSSTKITDNSAYSFVEIDVDWSRNLAYLGSRKTDTCLNVVDFSNHYAPALVKTIGSSSLQTCLGVKLFDNNTKVLLSSDNNNKIAAWNLTANPTDYASWTSMGEHSLGTKGRRIAKITPTSANNFEIHVSKRDGVLKANLDTSGGVGAFTTLNAYSNTTSKTPKSIYILYVQKDDWTSMM